MFRSFDDLPSQVQDRWRKLSTTRGYAQDWDILKSLVFESSFPFGDYNSTAQAAETAALHLYKMHGKISRNQKNKPLLGGNYLALYSYALENLMHKMWDVREELKLAGTTEELLSSEKLEHVDEAKRQQLKIYFRTVLAILLPIVKRKIGGDSADSAAEALAKDSGIAQHVINWVDDRAKFEHLKMACKGGWGIKAFPGFYLRRP